MSLVIGQWIANSGAQDDMMAAIESFLSELDQEGDLGDTVNNLKLSERVRLFSYICSLLEREAALHEAT